MDIADLRKEPHLSVSSINDYIACGLMYKLGRIDKLKPEQRSAAVELGSCVHLVLAEFYQEKMMGNRLPLEHLHEVFTEHWHSRVEGYDDISFPAGKDFEKMLAEGKEIIAAWYSQIPGDEFTVIAIEEPFSFCIGGIPVPIIGMIDLIEEDASGTVILTDFKTSGRAYAADEVDKNFQLTVYQMALKARGYPSSDMLLRFDCLIKTKTPRFEQYYTTRNANDENRALKKIREVWKGIDSGIFIPNDDASNWKCKNCAFSKACDEWFRR